MRLTTKLEAGLVCHKEVNARVHVCLARIYLSLFAWHHSLHAPLHISPMRIVGTTANAILALLDRRAFCGGAIQLQILSFLLE